MLSTVWEYKGITRTRKTKQNLSANYVSNEGSTPKTYKEFLKLTVKKKKKNYLPKPNKMLKQKNLLRHFSKEYIQMANSI